MKFNTYLMMSAILGFSQLFVPSAGALDIGPIRPIKIETDIFSQIKKVIRQNAGKVLNRGNGCPETVSATFSPDKKSISILFNDFTAEAGSAVGLTTDTKDCEVSIPLELPEGIRVSVQQVHYRGFYSVPEGGRMELISSTRAILNHSTLALFPFTGDSIANSQTIKISNHKKTVVEPITENFDLALDNILDERELCGKISRINIMTTLKVQSNKSGDQVLAVVDSMDVSPKSITEEPLVATYDLKYSVCRSKFKI